MLGQDKPNLAKACVHISHIFIWTHFYSWGVVFSLRVANSMLCPLFVFGCGRWGQNSVKEPKLPKDKTSEKRSAMICLMDRPSVSRPRKPSGFGRCAVAPATQSPDGATGPGKRGGLGLALLRCRLTPQWLHTFRVDSRLHASKVHTLQRLVCGTKLAAQRDYGRSINLAISISRYEWGPYQPDLLVKQKGGQSTK